MSAYLHTHTETCTCARKFLHVTLHSCRHIKLLPSSSNETRMCPGHLSILCMCAFRTKVTTPKPQTQLGLQYLACGFACVFFSSSSRSEVQSLAVEGVKFTRSPRPCQLCEINLRVQNSLTLCSTLCARRPKATDLGLQAYQSISFGLHVQNIQCKCRPTQQGRCDKRWCL